MVLPKQVESDQASKGKNVETDDDWIIGIKEKLKQASEEDKAESWTKLCIYRIPQCLRYKGDDKVYNPQTVSLGPYHHHHEKNKQLHDMDGHKWRALNHVLKRNNQSIELYLDTVKELEEQARSYYEGTLSLSSNEFAEMMVLDSSFMLELFIGNLVGFNELRYSRNDPIFSLRATTMHLNIQRDMILLENQIPLFILEKLLGLQKPTFQRKIAELLERLLGLQSELFQSRMVSDLALKFLDGLIQTDERPERGLSGQHCLDVFRQNLLIGSETSQTASETASETSQTAEGSAWGKKELKLIHCVTELKEKGIKFKRRRGNYRFWDIKFTDGVLEIPRLLIQDGTKSLFQNLIAYEQSHLDLDYTGQITTYVGFMDSLINTATDVSYLHYKGIVENWLGNDDDVAELFNKSCQEVCFNAHDDYLSKLTTAVNEYCDHKRNTWKASLRLKYFHSPWAIISLLAAVMLLALTCLQTFFTVYPYYVPRH